MPRLLAPGPGLDPNLAKRLDWGDEAAPAVILANPEWVKRHPAAAEAAQRLLPNLPGHLFVATSGTSRSGSTQPRWVALSRQALLTSAHAVNRHLMAGANEVWAHALPLFHVGGLGILARARLSGAAVEEVTAGRWDPVVFHQRAHACHATFSALVPTQVHDLVAAGLSCPPALRAVVVGGGRLEPSLCEQAWALGWPCLPSYGLTETASQVATASPDCLRGDTCPSALPLLEHAEARVDDEGAVWIRAASLLTCYVEIEGNAATAWDPRDRGGWFRTGDLGALHPDGLEIRGREADTVKVLGELVWLPRVEESAARWAAQEPALAGVRVDLAVAALPHPRLGHELVLALAVDPETRPLRPPEPGVLLASLQRFEAAATLPYARIRRVATVSAIPRTALGKCRRPLLASLLAGPATPAGGS
jgi:O-succinylbenzoic acid--CoA ligase